MRVLVTGATGFVGGEVVARLRARGASIVALVRDPSRAPAGVETVVGDVTDPLRVDGPLDEARRINVGGTERVLDLAASTGARLVHVSTAYVAGRHDGRFRERQLDAGQAFRNTYEETKAEAEALVHAAPRTVALRPSIVVGDSRTGRTTSFNVLYWPLRAFSRGLLDEVPASPDGRVDVVPVDFVADAITHVTLKRPDVRGALNLVAGDAAVTNQELLELACATLDRPRPRLVAPTEDHPLARVSSEAALYLPYFTMGVVFDDTRARAILDPAGIAAPPLRDYFERLVRYAEETRWGKRPLPAAA